MKTQITISCPSCLSLSIKKNGRKIYGKQNYQCKDCHRQFIDKMDLTYQGCQRHIDAKIRLMLVRGCSIADIMVIEKVSKYKVLNVLAKSNCEIKPTQNAYQKLQIDEFWTYVGHKKNKIWLIYAYDPDSGEIWLLYGGNAI
ncbi:Transposase and inactivated derivatives [Suttonella ornithocola]|uniref:Transposase and inactivated derivatives n=3 Tax=Suttonella ornithocola TaxID=279832 RepID=A0A380MZ00_9GAMM|nr:IS1 family transposase [Suttonella ornithocola]SUO97256.1 Transposase and inactivated derivatives [Suttonella ornithocola]